MRLAVVGTSVIRTCEGTRKGSAYWVLEYSWSCQRGPSGRTVALGWGTWPALVTQQGKCWGNKYHDPNFLPLSSLLPIVLIGQTQLEARGKGIFWCNGQLLLAQSKLETDGKFAGQTENIQFMDALPQKWFLKVKASVKPGFPTSVSNHLTCFFLILLSIFFS